jgi:beta-lactamase regulating signal transducer with metallopeptidase domain
MTSEVLAALLRANLIGGLAVLGVLALRIPTRRLFGPEIAYQLWMAPPLAAFATLLPARVVDGAPAISAWIDAVDDLSAPLFALWFLGAALVFAVLVRMQLKFMAEVRAGRAGPSVVGILSPRIFMPADDGSYTEQERALIRLHEREHVARLDPRAGAFASLLQGICWFNPLVHLGAAVMRLDQELACDAAVLRRRPRDRALYAKTLLKTQLAAQPLPFGCCWLAPAPHPLEVRIGVLKSPNHRYDGLVGPVIMSLAILGAGWAGWVAQPPAPRPPPLVELWKSHQHGPSMSVWLVSDRELPKPDA